MNKDINYELKYELIGRVEGRTIKGSKKFSEPMFLNDYLKDNPVIDEVIVYNITRGNKPRLIFQVYNNKELVKRKFLFYGKNFTLYAKDFNNFKDISIECNGAYIIELVKYTDSYRKELLSKEGDDIKN